MEESAGNHRHHSHHPKKNILNDFLRKIFGSDTPSSPQAEITGQEPTSVSDGSSSRKHIRKKRNPLDAWFMRQLEKLADKMETRREKRYKRKFHRAMKRRQRKESKSKTNIFRSFYKKYFERKSHPYGYYTLEGGDKEKQELRKQRRRLAFFSINSAILFVLTYLITYLTYQLAVMFVASRYGINSILLFYEVFFPVGNYSEKWNSFNIIIITFAGPLRSEERR